MSAILLTVLPVFGLIAIGYGAARFQFIGREAAQGLSQFVFNMALPALLFRTMVIMEPQGAGLVSLWIAYFGALAIIWIAASLLSRLTPALKAGDGGASTAMGSSFGNIVMLGLPLTLSHFGEAGAVPVSLIVSVHAPILWLVAVVQLEAARQGQAPSPLLLIRVLGGELLRNPIVVALVAGSLWRFSGLGLNPVIDRTLDLLSGAGVPTALVALGLSLAGYSLRGQWSGIALLIALKMIALPFAVWIAAAKIMHLPALWTHVAVLLAAMPTGANAYLFAQRYTTATPAVSGAIAIGTALALATTAALLYLMDGGVI
jgi:malonate transporter and related proteins